MSLEETESARGWARAARTTVGVLLLAACAIGFGSTFWLFAQPSPPGQTAPDATAASLAATTQDTERLQQAAGTLRDEARNLREESVKLQAALEGERREADAFRWLLTAIVGLGALYGLFQGLYSYFSVQAFNNQAERVIKDLREREEEVKKDFERFRKDCEARFPLFVGLEAALSRMASLLASRFGSSAVGAPLYSPIDEIGREEIYYYERSAAALEYMGFAKGVDHIQILRGFSSFYLEKYRFDCAEQQKPGRPAPDPNDLMRARFYLDRARSLYGANFRIKNAFGALAMLGGTAPDLDSAKGHFEESIVLEPRQQHARYALAWILDEKAKERKDRKLYEEVVKHLRLAMKETNWEDYAIPARTTGVAYNLACGLCRLAEFLPAGKQKDDLLAEAFEALKSWSKGTSGARATFDGDCKEGGDLTALYNDSQYKPKMDRLAASTAQPPTAAT